MKKQGTINLIVEIDENKIQISPEIDATHKHIMCAAAYLLQVFIKSYSEYNGISLSEAEKYVIETVLSCLPEDEGK